MLESRKLALAIQRKFSVASTGDAKDSWLPGIVKETCELYLTSLDEHAHIKELLQDCLKQLNDLSSGLAMIELRDYISGVVDNLTRTDETTKLCFLSMLFHECILCRLRNPAICCQPLATLLHDHRLSNKCMNFLTRYAEAHCDELLYGCTNIPADEKEKFARQAKFALPYHAQQVLSDNKFTLLRTFLRTVDELLKLTRSSSILPSATLTEAGRAIHALCELGCRTACCEDKWIAAECVAVLLQANANCSVQLASEILQKYSYDEDFVFMVYNCLVSNGCSSLLLAVCRDDQKLPCDAAFLTVLASKLHDASQNNMNESRTDAVRFLTAEKAKLSVMLVRSVFSGNEYSQAKCMLCLLYLCNMHSKTENCDDSIVFALNHVADDIMRHVQNVSASSCAVNFLQPALWRAAVLVFDFLDQKCHEFLWYLALRNLHYEHMQTCCADFIAKYCLKNIDNDSFEALLRLPQPIYDAITFRILPKIYQIRPELLSNFGHLIIKLYLECRKTVTLERLIALFRFMNKMSTTTSPPFYAESQLSESLMSSGITATLITAENPQLTLYGSQLLFEWRRLRDPFSADEAHLFELVCQHNLNRDYARFRQPFLRHIKKFFIRLRLSSIVLLKSESSTTSAADEHHEADMSKLFLENHKKIACTFVAQVKLCLEPGAWHARRATVLAILESVVNVFTSSNGGSGRIANDEIDGKKLSHLKKPSKASRSITYTDAHVLDDSECNPLYFLNANNMMLSLLHALVSETNSTTQTSLINIIVGLSESSSKKEVDKNSINCLTLRSIGQVVLSLMQSYRPRDSDVAVGFTRLALSLPQNHNADCQKVFISNIFDRFSKLVERVLDEDDGGLIKVLATDPLHSVLHVIRIVLVEISAIATRTKNSSFSADECRQLVSVACKNCTRLVVSVSGIVNAQTSDTYEPLSMDFMVPAPCILPSTAAVPARPSSELKMSAQALYVCTWRIMQNISYLFGDLCAHQLVQYDAELWSLIEQYFIDQLLQARHQGVFESAVDGYRQFIRSANPILSRHEADALEAKQKADEQQVVLQNYIRSTPSRILSAMCCLLNDDDEEVWPILFPDFDNVIPTQAKSSLNLTIRLKTSNSRRSAGLPDLIMSALKCGFERGSTLKRTSFNLLNWLIDRILKIFHGKVVEQTDEVSVERCVRFLNVLTELLRDEALLEVTASHCGRALTMAIDGLQISNWNINSASANLYAVLFNRLFSPRSNRPVSALTWRCDDTSLPASELFGRYPEVFDYFYRVLKTRVAEDDGDLNAGDDDEQTTTRFDVKTLCVTHIISMLTTSCGDDQLGSSFFVHEGEQNAVPRTLSSLTALLYAVAVTIVTGHEDGDELKIVTDGDEKSVKRARRGFRGRRTDEAISRSACHALMATLMPYPPPPLSPVAESAAKLYGTVLADNSCTSATANKIVNDSLAAFKQQQEPPRLLFELLRTVLVDYGLVYFGSKQQLHALRQSILNELIGLFFRQQRYDALGRCDLRQHEAALNLLHALLVSPSLQQNGDAEKEHRRKVFSAVIEPLLERILRFISTETTNDAEQYLNCARFADLRYWLNSAMQVAFDEKLSSRIFCCRWVLKLIVVGKKTAEEVIDGRGDSGQRNSTRSNAAVLSLVMNFLVKRLNACDENDDDLFLPSNRNVLSELVLELIILFEREAANFADSHGSSSSSFNEQYVEALLAALGSCLTIIALSKEAAGTKNDGDFKAEAERDDSPSSMSRGIAQLSVADNENAAGSVARFCSIVGRRLAVLLTRLINLPSAGSGEERVPQYDENEEQNKCLLLNRPAAAGVERLLRSAGVARQLTSLIALLYINSSSVASSFCCSCGEKARITSEADDFLPYAEFILQERHKILPSSISGTENVVLGRKNSSCGNGDEEKNVAIIPFQFGLVSCKACALLSGVNDFSGGKKRRSFSSSSPCACYYSMQAIVLHCAYHESAEVRATVAQIFMPIYLSNVAKQRSNCAMRTAHARNDDIVCDEKRDFFPYFYGWFLSFDLLRDNSDAVRTAMCETISRIAHDAGSDTDAGVEEEEAEQSGRGGPSPPYTQPCLSVLMRDLITYFVRVGVAHGRLTQYALAAAVYLTIHEQQEQILILMKKEGEKFDDDCSKENVEEKKIISIFDASEAANYHDDCAFAVVLAESFVNAFDQLARYNMCVAGDERDDENGEKFNEKITHVSAALIEWVLMQIKHLLKKISSLEMQATTNDDTVDDDEVNEKALINIFTTARQLSPLLLGALRMADAVHLLFMTLSFVSRRNLREKRELPQLARLKGEVQGVIARILNGDESAASSAAAAAARRIRNSLQPTRRLIEKLQNVC